MWSKRLESKENRSLGCIGWAHNSEVEAAEGKLGEVKLKGKECERAILEELGAPPAPAFTNSNWTGGAHRESQQPPEHSSNSATRSTNP